MRIAILGSGGVGGYYGGTLARAGHRVVMLARGSNLEALLARGIEVRTPEETFRSEIEATGDPMTIGPVDVAIVAVKSYSLSEIVPSARLLAESGATLLPFLNGVEAADRLVAGGVPKERVLGGLTSLSVARVAPGIFERKSPFQKVALGELDGTITDRARRIAAAFRGAGADATVSPDIVADLWRKLAFIASMAAGCGLARSPSGRSGRRLTERSCWSAPSGRSSPWQGGAAWP